VVEILDFNKDLDDDDDEQNDKCIFFKMNIQPNDIGRIKVKMSLDFNSVILSKKNEVYRLNADFNDDD